MVHYYLECQEGTSDKFYEITQTGCDVKSRYGRNGTDGQTQLKSFGSEAEAKKFADKTLAEKVKKGYVQMKSGGSAPEPAKATGKRKQEDEPPAPPAKTKATAPKAAAKTSIADEKFYYHLECVEGNSNKFYDVSILGNEVITSYGRIGSDGNTASKGFGSAEEARKFALKTVQEKLKKGYHEAEADEDADEDKAPAKKAKTVPAKAVPAPKAAPAPRAAAVPGKKGKKADSDDDEGNESGGNKTWMMECIEGTSNKFYEVKVAGAEMTTRYGRIGSDGTSTSKTYKNAADALKNALKVVEEKTKKGYELVDGDGGDDDEDEKPAKRAVPPAAKPKAAPAKKSKKAESEDEDDEGDDGDGGGDGNEKSHWMLECTEGNSNKFYEVTIEGKDVHTRYGRIDADGISGSKTYKNEAEARKQALKIVNEKLKKGYVDASPEEEDGEGGDGDEKINWDDYPVIEQSDEEEEDTAPAEYFICGETY